MTAGPLLSINGLQKSFTRHGVLAARSVVTAVDGIDLVVNAGEVVAVVGESGSGKTTMTRCVLGLERPDGGQIIFDGIDIARAGRRESIRIRRGIQPVFQDPYSSLDPRWPAARTVREALDAQRIGNRAQRDQRVRLLLERVGLPSRVADRRPRELSGGQRQRVCIAAALAPEPHLLLADEPVTALDVSVQAQVLNLLHEIQRDLGLAILLVAHDLSVVAHMSDRVAVMYRGRIVETGPTDVVFRAARHPYTQALLAASPWFDDDSLAPKSMLRETATRPDLVGGCRFRSRCGYAISRCEVVDPQLAELAPGHATACHVNPAAEANRVPRLASPAV
jgi:oligopeptide/dipeptide ABC transporter ATP-binding protein